MENNRKQNPHFILIDDDPLFARILVNVAYQEGIFIDYAASVEELVALSQTQRYDAAIIDFDLGDITGFEAAEQLREKLGLIPTLLVSHATRHELPSQEWPMMVKRFDSKSKGYHAILGAAKQLSGG